MVGRVLAVLVGALLLGGCGGGDGDSALVPATPSQTAATTSAMQSAPVGPAMPDVVGMRLGEARQLLSQKGYPKVEEVDASGQGRPVVEPLNWVVRAQDPPSGALVAQGTAVTLQVAKPTDGAGSSASKPGEVPNVVCKDLQSAQDALQEAGFFVLASTDATGQNRQQVVDRNWVVVSQSVAAGERPEPATRVTLGVVKFGESTGVSGCAS